MPTIAQMMTALRATGDDPSLKMDYQGSWYLSTRIKIGDGKFSGGIQSRGASPEDALIRAWREITAVKFPKYLTLGSLDKFHWNGFMWEPYRG